MALVVAWLTQGILAAVLSTIFGSRDPNQVNAMAKQAGEVCSHHIKPIFTPPPHAQSKPFTNNYLNACSSSTLWSISWTPWRPLSPTVPWLQETWEGKTQSVMLQSQESPWWRATSARYPQPKANACKSTCAKPTESVPVMLVPARFSAILERKSSRAVSVGVFADCFCLGMRLVLFWRGQPVAVPSISSTRPEDEAGPATTASKPT